MIARGRRPRRRVVVALRFTLPSGELLSRDYTAGEDGVVAPAPPAWLHDGPPDWVAEGTAYRDWPTPAATLTLGGDVRRGQERAARRALGLSR